jgi:hypothetical protein
MDANPKAIKSTYFDKASFQKQIDIMKEAAAKAEDIIDYEAAHNPEMLRAIEVVEDFLRKKHRLLYGGTAINAHLPKQYKIYDPEKSIPDYDFFTPDQDADIKLLTEMLRKAGFIEISAREGIHEGTIKMYVNFNPVADITRIDPRLYRLLSKREFRSNGLSFIDADTLRMLMYLELSRPMGQVSRWEKVYERLVLLNEFIPIRKCYTKIPKTSGLTEEQVENIMRKIVAEKRIFAGGDLVGFYSLSLRKKKRPTAKWLLSTHKPIYFYSHDPAKDAADLADLGLTFKKIAGVGDVMPTSYVAMINSTPSVVIIEESACHSYYTLPLPFTETLRIASLDTLVTLYFSLALMEAKMEGFGALQCVAQELVEISFRARSKPDAFPFPFISLKCSGYQTTMASLVREKIKRIATVKQRLREALARKQELNLAVKPAILVSRNNKTRKNNNKKLIGE